MAMDCKSNFCIYWIVISFQQKDSKKLIIPRNFANLFVFIGLCFLGSTSAIIFCGAGVIRNLITLYFAYKSDTKKVLKYVSSALLILLTIILNIIYWKNYYNLYSIVLGTTTVITFMQTKASTIHQFSVVVLTLSIVYYILLLSPMNVVITVTGLISNIIGIIRLDIRRTK